ncbi:MAG: serine hydrolase domain-containing protein [Paracoccaceae bacterium]
MNQQIARHFESPTAEISEALEAPLRLRQTTNPVARPAAILRISPHVLDNLGPDGPIFGDSGTAFSVGTFASNIRDALDGNCVGYGFAINRAGVRARSGGGGSRQLALNPDNNLRMSARRRMHTASVTKNITATTVMKAMQSRGISAAARVRDYLPTQWDLHSNVNNLRISDLLTHQSGFNTSGSDPHYSTLRDAMENATGWSASVPANAYDNRNFGLFRLILPYMVCPEIMANVEMQGWADGNYHTAVDQATQQYYKLLVRHYVFNPLDMQNMDCAPNASNAGRTMCYNWPNPSPNQAQDGGDKTDEAGGEGWVMSARQLAKYLRFRRYSNAFISAGLRDEMDDQRYGWRTIQGDQGTYLRHGGAYGGQSNGNCVRGSGPLRTCIMQFPVNVEVAVTVNSFVITCTSSLDRMIADAFDAAYV